MSNIQILASCPRLLTLESREIIEYLSNVFHIDPKTLPTKYSKKITQKEWFSAEDSTRRIKIFKTGIIDIKQKSLESDVFYQLSVASKFAQKTSKHLFHSDVIYDISFNYTNTSDLKLQEIFHQKGIDLLSATIKNGIYFTIRKNDDDYFITIRGVSDVKDVPSIIIHILSGHPFLENFNNDCDNYGTHQRCSKCKSNDSGKKLLPI